MNNLTFDVLVKLQASLPKVKAVCIVVNIDDALDIFRELRKMGYTLKRRDKLAIWEMYQDLSFPIYRSMISEIFVDRTRSFSRGRYAIFNRPEWKLDFPEDWQHREDLRARLLFR